MNMNLQRHIDEALWPYLRRRRVYVASMVTFFLFLGASVFLSPWQSAICDPIATVIMVLAIDSRDRYVQYVSRDAHLRYRADRQRWRIR